MTTIGTDTHYVEMVRGFLSAAAWVAQRCDDEFAGLPFAQGPGPVDDAVAAAVDAGLFTLDQVVTAAGECRDFVEFVSEGPVPARDVLLDMDASQAGHDFYLTRNGHGTGFWDRGLPGITGRELSDAASTFGDTDMLITYEGEEYYA